MGTVSATTISSGNTLDPGKETHRWWNNATDDPVLVEVFPQWSGDPSKSVEFVAELEVTRQWRKRIAKDTGTGSLGTKVAYESEIHYVVKNHGSSKATFAVRLVTFKP